MTVFLDFDNTLMDNDAVRQALGERLSAVLGEREAARFWVLYEEVRAARGLVDIPETVKRFRASVVRGSTLPDLQALVFRFPFADYVYPGAAEAIAHLKGFAVPVVLSDGDQGFQPEKIRRSGIGELVDGNVRVYAHKEEHARDLIRDFPSNHYVMVDDKPRIHLAMREAFGQRITTVMVCQGKYAHDPSHHDYPDADLTVEGIGGLVELGPEDLIEAGEERTAERP